MTTPISQLPTPPSPADSPVDFNTKAFALLGALPAFVTEANAQASGLDAAVASAGLEADAAALKAVEALTSANNAAISKTGADSARDAAVIAKNAAEAALDSFDDRYLGAKAVAPTTDNDGAALLPGAMYWDTVLGAMRAWSGSVWVTLAATTAAAISNTPSGSIAATTVQAALDELDAAKVASGDLSASTGSSLVGFLQSGTGAVPRTVQAKERDSVSVKDFGAVGDGVADDTVAIQAALNAANSLPYQVTEVRIPRGLYKITATITQPANVVISGPGTIQPTSPFTGAVVWHYDNTAGYQDASADSRGGIERLRIKASGAVTATALKLTLGWSNIIKNVLLTGVTGNGVHIVSGLWCIENVKAQHAFTNGINTAIGFFMDGCADTSITNSEAVGYNTGLFGSANAGGNSIYRVHAWGYWYDSVSGLPTGPLCRFPFVEQGSNNVYTRCIADTPETTSRTDLWSQSNGGIGFSILANNSSFIGCVASTNPAYGAPDKLCGYYISGAQNSINTCNAFTGMANAGRDGLVFSTQAAKLVNYVVGGGVNVQNAAAVIAVPFSYNPGSGVVTSPVSMTVTSHSISAAAVALTFDMVLAADPLQGANACWLTGQGIPYSTTRVCFPMPFWSATAKNIGSKPATSMMGVIHNGQVNFYMMGAGGVQSNALYLNDFQVGTFSGSVIVPITV